MVNTVALLGMAIGVVAYFIPSLLAVLRGNLFKGQVIKYQLIILAISLVVVIVVFMLGVTTTRMVSHKEPAAAVSPGDMVVTESAAERASGPSWISMLVMLGGGAWSLIAIVLWFYVLIHALKDTEMTLLSRFGIHI